MAPMLTEVIVEVPIGIGLIILLAASHIHLRIKNNKCIANLKKLQFSPDEFASVVEVTGALHKAADTIQERLTKIEHKVHELESLCLDGK